MTRAIIFIYLCAQVGAVVLNPILALTLPAALAILWVFHYLCKHVLGFWEDAKTLPDRGE